MPFIRPVNSPPAELAAFILRQPLGRLGRVEEITAKDKLRRLLGHGLIFGNGGAFSFSAEPAGRAHLLALRCARSRVLSHQHKARARDLPPKTGHSA